MEVAHIPLGLVVVPDNVQNPDDATLQAFLSENREQFRVEEQVNLQFVRVLKTYSAEDSLEAREIIQSALEEYQEGEDYSVLVDAYSEAPPSRRGGDQGTLMGKEQFSLPALRDSIFAMDVEEVSGIIATNDGFHIIKVEQRAIEEDIEKVKVAEIFIPLRPSQETLGDIRDSVLAFADSARVAGFESTASLFGFETDSTGLFAREDFPRGLGRIQEALDFAFEGSPGDISRPIETADAWYVTHIERRIDTRDPELAEIRERVRPEWIQSKRRELGRAKAEALLAEVLGGKTLEEVAEADSLARYQVAGPITRAGFVPGVGSSPQLLGAAFASDTTDAPKAVHTDRGSFVFKILEKVSASRDDFEGQKEQLRARLLQQRQNEVLTTWLTQLEEQAEIEDFRRTLASL
jgi:peptidyl-prolyl cis-trans isomerase D